MSAPERRGGRPRASSRETLAEAACELFLEQGYAQTTIADIAQRAGVSRASFFNYFSSKAEVIWSGFDARVEDLGEQLESSPAGTDVRAVLAACFGDLIPDTLTLVLAHAQTMGLDEEIEQDSALRQGRIATAVGHHLRRSGAGEMQARITGAALAAAVVAAVHVWSSRGAGRDDFSAVLAEAFAAVHG